LKKNQLPFQGGVAFPPFMKFEKNNRVMVPMLIPIEIADPGDVGSLTYEH